MFYSLEDNNQGGGKRGLCEYHQRVTHRLVLETDVDWDRQRAVDVHQLRAGHWSGSTAYIPHISVTCIGSAARPPKLYTVCM